MARMPVCGVLASVQISIWQLCAGAAAAQVHCSAAIDQKACGPGRVFCGSDARSSDFKWSVSLQRPRDAFSWYHQCTATIVHPEIEADRVVGWNQAPHKPEWLITAAHCLVEADGAFARWKTWRAVAGQNKLNIGPEAAWIRSIDKVCVPLDYDGETFANDLAVVRLEPSDQQPDRLFGASVEALVPGDAKGPGYGGRTAAYASVFVSGWGWLNTGDVPCTQQFLQQPVVEASYCRAQARKNGYLISDDKLCAGFSTGVYGDCKGDSGGGLVSYPPGSEDQNGIVLVGVTSSGKQCAGTDGNFNFYTDVARHLAWIEQAVSALGRGGAQEVCLQGE